jgi:hypothetical protein
VHAGIDPAANAALSRELPATAVWSLLLEVFAARARARRPAAVLQQYERDGFVQPAPIDQRVLVALDAHLLAAASDFDAIELSPLAPLGACSVVGPTSQHKIVSALRGTEVVSDPTNVLALECARRLRTQRAAIVRLATCHRCVRAQPLPKLPGFAPHFRIFCLASGGHEQADSAWSVDELLRHIATHLAGLDRLETDGYRFADRHLSVLATPARAGLADRIAARVDTLRVERGTLTHTYYDGLRFQIHVRAPDGSSLPLIDGGAFDWLGTLSANRKLRLIASGMGAQLAAYLFRHGGPP